MQSEDKSFCIVAPYRNRPQHLKKWIAHYKRVLPDVPLYVIEQADDKPFNRGKLFNAFYDLIGKNFDYVIYHDIDMRIMETRGDQDLIYSYPKSPTLLATYIEQFNWGRKDINKWKPSYDVYFGGIVSINREDYLTCGGFSNNIWSWGNEDDCIRKSIIDSGLKIEKRDAWVRCDNHERKIDPENFKKGREIVLSGMNRLTDGVQFCEYELVGTHINDDYMHILINL